MLFTMNVLLTLCESINYLYFWNTECWEQTDCVGCLNACYLHFYVSWQELQMGYLNDSNSDNTVTACATVYYDGVILSDYCGS